MHTLYFVKIKADNSEDAREKAYYILESNNFASDNNGFYGSSKADWYVVGGRWSGLFTDKTAVEEAIKPLLTKELEKSPDLLGHLYINEHIVSKELREQIDAISIKTINHPYFRSTYSQYGYDDDAVIITEDILKKLKTKEYEEVEVADITEDDYIDAEYPVNELTNANIGEWLVIIDYHN